MNIYFESFRIDKNHMETYEIEEHSLEDFGNALNKIIKASGITHQVLAKALKVSNTTVHNYIMGYRRNPTKEFIIKIADYFDVKPSYFREYRMFQLYERFDMFPELIDVFIDLAMNPTRVKEVVKVYNNRNHYDNFNGLKKEIRKD
ncbi:MAG: helix-turn-helix transcriptional regulator [Atribacterota bacterium]|nr:helix-turn-helix transcriptional regulator [Atribacterota bacterium]